MIKYSKIYAGKVIHTRFKPKKHHFKYNVFSLLIDLDEINELTDTDVSDELYEYLQHWPKKYWYGLTGKTYEFIPGNGIQFDSRKIHATSTMYCKEKLGLTIRYS